MTEDLEAKLEEFEDWLIDEMRFSPSTVKSTIRKMKFVAEKCDLKLSSIGEETITVKGKGQKERTIYLPKEAKEAIERYLGERSPTDREYLFTTERGKMTYDYFRKRCEIVSLKAGVKFHPHMARHTYATKLLRQGVSVSYVARMLGHEDLSSTQIYLHPSQEEAIEEVRKVDFFLGSNSLQNGWYGLAGNWSANPIEEKELVLFFGEVLE